MRSVYDAEEGRIGLVANELSSHHGRYNPFSGPGFWARLLALFVKLVLYYTVGFVYYRYMSSDLRWTLLQSVYFTTLSVTTVGYGDIAPSSEPDKMFTIVYISIGIIAVVSSVADALSALFEEAERFGQHERAHRASMRDGVEDSFYWKSELKWFLCIAIMLLSGAFVMWLFEGFDIVDALFWSFQTATTIGYGDEVIRHKYIKGFVIVYALFSSIGLTYAMARILAMASDVSYLKKRSQLLHAKLDQTLIHRLDKDGRGVDRAEFVVGMLRILGHVTDADAKPWFDRFDELDIHDTGRLTASELRAAFDSQPDDPSVETSETSSYYYWTACCFSDTSAQNNDHTWDHCCGSWRTAFWHRFKDALFCFRHNRRRRSSYQFWRRPSWGRTTTTQQETSSFSSSSLSSSSPPRPLPRRSMHINTRQPREMIVQEDEVSLAAAAGVPLLHQHASSSSSLSGK